MMGVALGVDAAVGRGDDQDPIRRENPAEFVERSTRIWNVLDRLEPRDEVEGAVRVSDALQIAHDELGATADTTSHVLDHLEAFVKALDPLGPSTSQDLGSEPRAAAGIEDLRPRPTVAAQR
jgi:hypothetical protein